MIEIKRIFPFDSGAFSIQLYNAYMHKKMQLTDFSLEPDPSTPGRLISLFFGSVESYLAANPSINRIFDPSEFEALSYQALVNAKEGNSIDSRGSGIEVQTEQEIPLKDNVEAVIIPSAFVDGKTGDLLKKMGIHPIPYSIFDRSRPSEYFSKLTELCLSYYLSRGLVSGERL
ncbi:hypothetical protein GCM10011317_17990 [Niveispirillum cyanobacteriorum]|nr:hypothetical protein GCM10011317_17990 [Niveispirillum cyanobacteriorum]